MRNIIAVFSLVSVLAAPAYADIETGLLQFEQGNFKDALKTLTVLAEQGDVQAQYLVGIVLLNSSVDEPRADDAVLWLTRAAEQGHLGAQMELARIYRIGEGVPADESKMVKWYQEAAKQGDVGAQLLTADAYAYGHGVEPDYVRAYMWYEIALRYWGDLAIQARDVIAEKMSSEQIQEARRLASEMQVPAAK